MFFLSRYDPLSSISPKALQINNVFEIFGETEAGTWFLNTAVFFTLLRMFAYYFFWQPSALRHFQTKYGQTWNVGHHLYGTNAPNPLRK